MSRVAGEVVQRLEREIEATATSTAVTAQIQTQDAVEGMRCHIQAQLDRNLAELRCCKDSVQKSVADVAGMLGSLTQQLNEYHLMRKSEATVDTTRLAGDIEAPLQAHSL